MVADQAHGICPKCGGEYVGATETAKQEKMRQIRKRWREEERKKHEEEMAGWRGKAYEAAAAVMGIAAVLGFLWFLKWFIGFLIGEPL